eukprot:maker-scaffold1209_size55568-snap-gene-0.11 protein:Tk03743 transcript:maker-scaffold1209_size55568-snap-gene-0.11-mRNA-1 annotation:"hypothetical protein AaeL_AAEL006002"
MARYDEERHNRRSILEQQPSVKWINVIENDGSTTPKVKRHLVQMNHTPNMDYLKAELTDKLTPQWGMVRNLYTPAGGTVVDKIGDLQADKAYVAGGVKFKPVPGISLQAKEQEKLDRIKKRSWAKSEAQAREEARKNYNPNTQRISLLDRQNMIAKMARASRDESVDTQSSQRSSADASSRPIRSTDGGKVVKRKRNGPTNRISIYERAALASKNRVTSPPSEPKPVWNRKSPDQRSSSAEDGQLSVPSHKASRSESRNRKKTMYKEMFDRKAAATVVVTSASTRGDSGKHRTRKSSRASSADSRRSSGASSRASSGDSRYSGRSADTKASRRSGDSRYSARSEDSRYSKRTVDSRDSARSDDSRDSARSDDSRYSARSDDSRYSKRSADSKYSARSDDSKRTVDSRDSARDSARSEDSRYSRRSTQSADSRYSKDSRVSADSRYTKTSRRKSGGSKYSRVDSGKSSAKSGDSRYSSARSRSANSKYSRASRKSTRSGSYSDGSRQSTADSGVTHDGDRDYGSSRSSLASIRSGASDRTSRSRRSSQGSGRSGSRRSSQGSGRSGSRTPSARTNASHDSRRSRSTRSDDSQRSYSHGSRTPSGVSRDSRSTDGSRTPTTRSQRRSGYNTEAIQADYATTDESRAQSHQTLRNDRRKDKRGSTRSHRMTVRSAGQGRLNNSAPPTFDRYDRSSSIFSSNPGSGGKIRTVEVDYDQDSSGMYRAKKNLDLNASHAKIVLDSTATKIDTPIDYQDAEEVEEDERMTRRMRKMRVLYRLPSPRAERPPGHHFTYDRVDIPISINPHTHPFFMPNDDIMNPDMLDPERLRDLPHIMVNQDEILHVVLDDPHAEASEEPEAPEEKGNCCHPSNLCHKGLALFLMCVLGFGSYFCFDTPGALQNEIKSVMNISTYQFASLYSWYSWPNVILPIFGGFLIDRVLGLRVGASVFAFALIIGQVCFALGGYFKNFVLMEIGRFIFGIGGESLAVAQNTYTTTWFSGDLLNTVFGLQLSVARLGSTACFQVTGILYNFLRDTYIGSWSAYQILGTTLMATVATCGISFVASLILGYMDKRKSRILHDEDAEVEQINLTDIRHFPAQFWLISLICVAYYVAIFPFVSLGQVFYMKKFDFSFQAANTINGMIYLISCFASPLFGMAIDRLGRNVLFVAISVVTTMVGHGLLALTFVNPYIGVSLIGLAYSLLASSLWPQITYIIPEHQRGTAFGLMQAIQNLGLATITLLAGWIEDEFGYFWLEMFFIVCLSLGMIATIVLWLVDGSRSQVLNMNRRDRMEFMSKPNPYGSVRDEDEDSLLGDVDPTF